MKRKKFRDMTLEESFEYVDTSEEFARLSPEEKEDFKQKIKDAKEYDLYIHYDKMDYFEALDKYFENYAKYEEAIKVENLYMRKNINLILKLWIQLNIAEK